MKLERHPDHIVNIDDLVNKFWHADYLVTVSSQGIAFLVNADYEQDALDQVMDYIVELDFAGLYSTLDYDQDEFISAGNYGYKFTTHNIHIEEL